MLYVSATHYAWTLIDGISFLLTSGSVSLPVLFKSSQQGARRLLRDYYLSDMHSRRSALRDRIASIRTELAKLEDELQELDDRDQRDCTPNDLPMLLDEYKRYGRQMILPGFGLPGALDVMLRRYPPLKSGSQASSSSEKLASSSSGQED